MIKKWKFDKNIKRHEMNAVVRKRNERQSCVPPKQSAFRVRGYEVDSSKIDRFERTNRFDRSINTDMLSRKLKSPIKSVC